MLYPAFIFSLYGFEPVLLRWAVIINVLIMFDQTTTMDKVSIVGLAQCLGYWLATVFHIIR